MSAPKTFLLAGNRDTTIKLKADDGMEYRYEVQRLSVALLSPYWKNLMLNDRFVENDLKEIPIEEDGAEALLILFKIAHLEFQNLPSKITIKVARGLIMITDKYGCEDKFEDVAKSRQWAPAVDSIDLASLPTDEDGLGQWEEDLENDLKWATKFKNEDIFKSVVDRLILAKAKDNDGPLEKLLDELKKKYPRLREYMKERRLAVCKHWTVLLTRLSVDLHEALTIPCSSDLGGPNAHLTTSEECRYSRIGVLVDAVWNLGIWTLGGGIREEMMTYSLFYYVKELNNTRFDSSFGQHSHTVCLTQLGMTYMDTIRDAIEMEVFEKELPAAVVEEMKTS